MVVECIFCSIIAGIIPADVIAESPSVIVIKDKFPKAPIHYLIIPKVHYRMLQDMDNASISGELISMAQSLVKVNPSLNDFKLVLNNGYAAGQRVFHVHMHFLSGQIKIDLEKII